MSKALSKTELAALASLVEASGLSYRALAARLDVDEQTLARWIKGDRPPNHPAMLRRALEMIVLEQSGVITARLIEQSTKS